MPAVTGEFGVEAGRLEFPDGFGPEAEPETLLKVTV